MPGFIALTFSDTEMTDKVNKAPGKIFQVLSLGQRLNVN